MSRHYGDAYDFDGYRWRYTHDGKIVPDSSTYVDPRTGDAHMNAPELLVHQMLDIPGLAIELKLQQRSIATMLYQDRLPQPQFRAGKQGPLWARPVVQAWKDRRPGQAWRRGVRQESA